MAIKNGKYVKEFIIEIKNTTVIHIGDGDDELLLDRENNQVIIPGTSISGAFRAFLNENNNQDDVNKMFGDDGELSKIFIYDSFAAIKGIEIRPAVKIDSFSGTNENKFDRNFICEGQIFKVNIEIYENDEANSKKYREFLYKCLLSLDNGDIRLGAYKNSGAGVFKIISIEEREFNLNDKKQLKQYALRSKASTKKSIEDLKSEIIYDSEYVTFIVEGNIETPLLIKGYSSLDNKRADGEQLLNFNGKAVIPGSSLKGVIRAQGEKILKYFNKDTLIDDIFGTAHNDNNENTNKASRLIAFDTVLDKYDTKRYNRIKIDRFTGGVMSGALMQDEPIMGQIKLKIKYKKCKCDDINNSSIGLLSLIMRDIAKSNLPLGSGNNIGRGRIKGNYMEVKDGDTYLFLWDILNNEVKVNNLDKHINCLNK